MHCTSLITHPARAAAFVATVGLLFGAQSALTLAGFGSGGYAPAVLVAALAASIVALGIFAPLHSRSGGVAVGVARTGLGLALVTVIGSSVVGSPIWLPVLVTGLCIAANGAAWLSFARRHEGDIPARLLELTLAVTVIGVLLAPVGGCLVAGTLWLAVAAALWSAYAAPAAVQLGEASASPALG